MGLMDKYNKGGVRFNVDIEGFTFCQLKDLYSRLQKDEVVKIDGIYINTKGRFDAHPVAIVSTLSLLVDLPPHLTEDVKEMLQDDECVEAIRSGHVGFTIREYEQSTYKKTCYGIHWEDIA